MRSVVLLLLLFLIPDLSPANPLENTGNIRGIVVDVETGDPITFAYLHLEQINRTTTTDRDGQFELRNVPDGTYEIYIHRIGYSSLTRKIEVIRGQTEEFSFQMTPTVFSGQEVEVVSTAEQTTGSNLEHASLKIVGERLRRDLDVTLSGTLSNQAGFSERSMGAAPGRPVMRGLGDERVLILSDGGRTGDVSWTSGDHSVTVDPSSADEIEIARGPAALEYGSGAIGGVINVVRNQIPNSVPTRTTGSASLQGASVNQGLMGAGSVTIPYNDLVLNVDINGRLGQDFNTPTGKITNTYLRTSDNAFGLGYIKPWGYAGISGSAYFSEYGIPPDPEGGHPSGVDIEMYKYQTEARTEIVLNNSLFSLIEARGSFTRYHHVEIESSGSIGTQYDMDTTTGQVKARNKGWGLFDEGVIGIWGEYVDYAVFGSRTPNSNSVNTALFAIQERDIGNLHLEAGFRLNHSIATPERERPNSFIGHVRERTFTGLETALSGIYDIGSGYYIGSTFMHTWRAPTLEELYSEGPHLAAFAFEVGNPDLEHERGYGGELFARYRTNRASLELAGYYNYFSNFLYAQDTGRPSIPRADLNEFQFIGTQATLYGAEVSAEYQFLNNFAVDGNLSFTIGDRVIPDEAKENANLTESNQPLPMIPPFKGNLGIRYNINNFSFGTRMRAAAAQNRIGENETPTEGYTVFDFNSQYRFDWGGMLHTISLSAQNVFNEEHYNHLSLIKEIFPEPGRSFNLLYRVYF